MLEEYPDGKRSTDETTMFESPGKIKQQGNFAMIVMRKIREIDVNGQLFSECATGFLDCGRRQPRCLSVRKS